jgi:hypothetical protein
MMHGNNENASVCVKVTPLQCIKTNGSNKQK